MCVPHALQAAILFSSLGPCIGLRVLYCLEHSLTGVTTHCTCIFAFPDVRVSSEDERKRNMEMAANCQPTENAYRRRPDETGGLASSDNVQLMWCSSAPACAYVHVCGGDARRRV